MNDWERILIYIVLFMVALFMITIGNALPDELENGCIVHNNKVYCEEINKMEDNDG